MDICRHGNPLSNYCAFCRREGRGREEGPAQKFIPGAHKKLPALACPSCDYTTPYWEALRRHVCDDKVQPGVEGVADELIASLSETPEKRVADQQSERKVSESGEAPALSGEHPPLNMGITTRGKPALQDAVASPFPRRRRRGGSALRLFRLLRLLRLLRSVATTALFCTVLVHVAVFIGIVAYVGIQRGAPEGVPAMVADTFTNAREAYAGAWRGIAD